jgi:hypothetical protein
MTLSEEQAVLHIPGDARSRALTPDDAAAVRREFRADLSARLQDLAGRYGVNIGRISEALRGKRP